MKSSTQKSDYLLRFATLACFAAAAFFGVRAVQPTPNMLPTAAAEAPGPATPSSPTPNPTTPGPTSVTPPFQTKNIEDIQPGDLVLARDEHGTEIGWKPVKEVYRRTSHHLRHLTFESANGTQQALSTTDEHPFWSVTANDFIEAGSLPVGHKVNGPDGEQQTLVSSTRENHPDGIEVFNFQVEDFHTYYVAATNANDVVLVHNAEYSIPAYVGSGINPVPVGKPSKNVDDLIGGVDAIPQSLKGTISQSEAAARELAEDVAKRKGIPPSLVGPESHNGGLNHFHLEQMRHWHFWF